MFVALINATSITSIALEIDMEFDVHEDSFPNSYWTVASWTLAAGIVPIFLTPVIEDYGVRPGFLGTYLLFCVFIFPQAFATNFATLVICRSFAGGFAGTIVALTDVVVVDLFEYETERVKAIIVYTFVLLAGYTLGPVYGGGIEECLQWRWIFYIQLIVDFALLLLLYFVLHETRASLILKRIAKQKREEFNGTNSYYTRYEIEAQDSGKSLWQGLKKALIRPAQMLTTEAVLVSFTLWSAFTTGVLFTFTQSTGQVYAELFGWGEFQAGVVQVAIFVGQFVGLVACWFDDARHIRQKQRRQQQFHLQSDRVTQDSTKSIKAPVIETRLYLSLPATFLGLAGGLFVYAFTAYPHLPWIAPTIGLFLVGFASMCIVTAVDIYITHSYAKYAGSAIAIVALGENVFAAFLPLSALSMYTHLGLQWASSLLAFISLGLCAIPIILIVKGEAIRRKSPFMNEGIGQT